MPTASPYPYATLFEAMRRHQHPATGVPVLSAGTAAQRKFDAVVIYDISRGAVTFPTGSVSGNRMTLLHIQVASVEDHIGDILNPADYLTELITVRTGATSPVLTSRQKSGGQHHHQAKTTDSFWTVRLTSVTPLTRTAECDPAGRGEDRPDNIPGCTPSAKAGEIF